MNTDRFVVTDQLWDRISGLIPGRDGVRGVTGKDNRLFLEAVLWRVRAGLPWRDLPPEFGKWNTQFRRFRRWAAAGVFERLFEALNQDPGEPSRVYRRVICSNVRRLDHSHVFLLSMSPLFG